MSGLAALLAGHTEPGVYQWHSAAPAGDVQHAVEKAGWTFRHLDCWTCEDRATFLKGLAAELGLPPERSDDLDGLDAALASLRADGAGTVLLWDGWSPLARHDEEAFGRVLAALGSRAGAGDRFAVILRGEGPALELEELPIKH